MGDKVLQLIIRARDEASKVLKDVTGASDGLADSLITAAPVIAAGAAGYVGLLQVGGDLIKSWQDNTIEVGNFAEKMGITTEAASGLITAAGILGVSADTLEGAFKTMAKNGIEPSLDGLLEVKDRLDKAGSPAERLALATKLLGGAGADLIPILAGLNADQLPEFNRLMEVGAIVTQDQYEAALRQRDALAEVNVQWSGIKLHVGEFISLKTLPFLENMNKFLSGQVGYLEAILKYFRELGGLLGFQDLKDITTGGPPPGKGGGRQHGGSFTVGGRGGLDSTLVAFRATPGEQVNVTPPGGSSDSDRLLSEISRLVAEVRRLTNTMPVVMRDALTRAQ